MRAIDIDSGRRTQGDIVHRWLVGFAKMPARREIVAILAGFATEIAAVPEGIVVGVGGEGGGREEFG